MQNKQSANLQSRIVWVDILRFIAIFMVIAIHCSDSFNVSPEAASVSLFYKFTPKASKWVLG